jgi:serine/threonine-protein kinase
LWTNTSRKDGCPACGEVAEGGYTQSPLESSASAAPRRLGRYLLFDEIGCGGMATVHLGRLLGAAGFARTVAIKRLHPQFAKDPAFVSMLVDEARLAARIRHPHVVGTLDVALEDGELFVVMDYVDGASMAHLQERLTSGQALMPWRLAAFVAGQTLLGLHAAHEATSEQGEPLGIVHRDVSPHNVLVGADGVVRVADFGVAKAAARVSATPDGKFKGKLAYMAPSSSAVARSIGGSTCSRRRSSCTKR